MSVPAPVAASNASRVHALLITKTTRCNNNDDLLDYILVCGGQNRSRDLQFLKCYIRKDMDDLLVRF